MKNNGSIRCVLVNNGVDMDKLEIIKKGNIKFVEYDGIYLGISFSSTIRSVDYLARVDNTVAKHLLNEIKKLEA